MDVLRVLLDDLTGRVGGPLSFRLILQPAMALLLGVRAGLADARTGAPAYFWSILSDRAGRWQRIREGWQAVARVFVLAVVIDLAYQLVATGRIVPGEGLLVAFVLAFVPYLLIRGPVNRIARICLKPRKNARA